MQPCVFRISAILRLKKKRKMFAQGILKQKSVDSAEGRGNLIYEESSTPNDSCIKVRANAHSQGHAAITAQTRSVSEDILVQVGLLS